LGVSDRAERGLGAAVPHRAGRVAVAAAVRRPRPRLRAPARRGGGGAMKIHPLHAWDLTPEEAVEVQREVAPQVETRTPLTKCELIAGAAISYNRYSSRHYAAVVVLRLSDWTVVETQEAVGEVSFPYVPGLLSFREAPVLLEAFAKVQAQPDAVM